jgi:hypothetical protein
MAEESGSSKSRRGRKAKVEGEFAEGVGVYTALIRGETFGIKAVQYALVEGECIVEGDISLGTEEEVAQQSDELAQLLRGQTPEAVLITGSQFRWPNCRVAYDIDPALPDQQRITDAIAHWEANTRYRFTLRTTANAAQLPDWITFRPSTGCSSPVGRRGGQQFINLAGGCPTGSVIHEIGHAIGLWHEQSREDRDAFITIHWDKIQAGTEHNFNQHISDGDDVGPYDYGSIMHYPRTAFSTDGSETITPVDPNAQIGQRAGLSPGDIAAVNSLCPLVTIKEPIKDRKEPVKDIKEPVKDRKEPAKDVKEFREPVPTGKEFREPVPTGKEFIEPVPTGKEFREPVPTGKEFIEPVPTGKEFREPVPTGKEFVEPIPGPGQVVRPGFPGMFGGALPFAVATPHQAGVGDPAGSDLEASAAELQQYLEAIAAAMAESQQSQAELEQQYAEIAAALQQTLDALGGA